MARVPILPLLQDMRETLAGFDPVATMAVHVETRNHFLEANLASYERLVVTFEDARGPFRRPDPYRQGWGVKPFLRRGVSVLAVKPKACEWYSRRDLPETFELMRPFFARFGEIVTYGMSMGGFAALTFADLIGAKRVVSLAPQSTYRLVDGKREHRYPSIHGLDHMHPWGDAVEGCRTPADVWLVYDPHYRMDRWHAERFDGPNIRRLYVPFAGHGVPNMLQGVHALDMMVDLVTSGRIDQSVLYRKLRGRRELETYRNFMRMKMRDHPWLAARLAQIWPDSPRSPRADAASSGKNDDSASQTE